MPGTARPVPHAAAGHAVLPADGWLALREKLGLSTREFQIVQCVFDDQKQEVIALKLGISPSTVNTYMQRVYTKLTVASRAQLIVRVMAEYLHSTPLSCVRTTDERAT